MFQQFTDELITIVAAAGSAFVTWIFARKKNQVEVQGNEIDNVQKAAAIWRELAEKLEQKVDKLLEENVELRIKISLLEKQILSLTNVVKSDIESHKITPDNSHGG